MNKKIFNAKVVAFGDSITAGNAVPEGSLNWTEMIKEAFNLQLINSGVGGNTSLQGLERLDRDVLCHLPDFVTINFGMNDHCMVEKGIAKVGLPEFEKNISSMIDKVRAVNAVPVLITTNYFIEGTAEAYYYSRHDPSFYEGTGGALFWLDQYMDSVRKVAQKTGSDLVDVRAVCDQYDPHDFLKSLKNCNTDDGVHPHTLGIKVYAQMLISYLKNNFL